MIFLRLFTGLGWLKEIGKLFLKPLLKYLEKRRQRRERGLTEVARTLGATYTKGGEAIKHDSDKPRLDLLSVDAQVAIAKIMTFGAKKYGDQNWRQGFAYSRLYAALQRHLTSWWNGDNLDSETGASHLHHAGCCLQMLIEHEIRNLGTDDRYYKGAAKASSEGDRLEDKKPSGRRKSKSSGVRK
jgi:hypothetical protein